RMLLRVPVDSFDSGHHDFDQALRKAFESERHPLIEIEGVAREGKLEGRIELAGTARPILVKLHMERVGGNIIAVASFAVDLRGFGVGVEGVGPPLTVEALVRFSSDRRPEGAGSAGLTAM